MDTLRRLRKDLAVYDGRSPAILSEIAARHKSYGRYLSNLSNLAGDEEIKISEGATWLLKAALEEGQLLSSENVKQIMSGLHKVTAWQAQLHLCQSIQYLVVPEGVKFDLEKWLEALLDAPRPLLRAWSVDALCRLWGRSAPRARILLDRMEKDGAASVRARLRRIRRELAIE